MQVAADCFTSMVVSPESTSLCTMTAAVARFGLMSRAQLSSCLPRPGGGFEEILPDDSRVVVIAEIGHPNLLMFMTAEDCNGAYGADTCADFLAARRLRSDERGGL
jgi:hypothetical protein